MGLASKATARGRRRRHRRAGLLPAGLRRRAARGPRARHRDRRREPDAVPVRPRRREPEPGHRHAASSRSGAIRRRPSSPRRRTRSPASTTRTSRRSGSARAASASRGSSRSRSSTNGSAPYAKWYLGGKLNVAYNCLDRHVEAGRGDKVAYHWEGEPEGDRRDAHLRRPAARGDEARERAQGARRRQGHAGRDLHGHGPGGAGRDARVRAARRAAHGRLRRLLRRLALGPAAGHGLRGADHAGRGVAARHDRAAEADRRRGGRRLAERQERRRPAPHRQRRADDRGPRPLVARARDRRVATARPSRWTPRTCSTCSTRRARPRSRRGSRTRPPATSSASRRRTTTSST